MIKFKNFILLNEGGNAIDGVVRISKNDFNQTIENLFNTVLPKLKLKKESVKIIGSSGKKETSGDIDIAIDINDLIRNNKIVGNLDNVYDFLIEKIKELGFRYADLRSLGLISFAFPISNKSGEFVQIDFILTDNLDFTEWIYYGPNELESSYKGLYRNLLLIAIVKYSNFKSLKDIEIDGKKLNVTWERYMLSMKDGLMKIRQTLEGKQKILKNPKTFDRQFLTKDKNLIIKIIFGEKYKPEDILTFEDLWKIINSNDFKYKDRLNLIIDDFKNGLINLGYPLPKEII